MTPSLLINIIVVSLLTLQQSFACLIDKNIPDMDMPMETWHAVSMQTPCNNPKFGYFAMEKWKDIRSYEGLYMVSDRGRVKSVYGFKNMKARSAGFYNRDELIMRPRNNKNYYHVTLYKNGEQKMFLVHRLVADAFIANPMNKPCVNHMDGDKYNNNASNLEWCTYKENDTHARETGLSNMRPRAKLNELIVRVIRKCPDLLLREFADIWNVDISTIGYARSGKNWEDI